jgi:hypothetical protein
MARRRAAKNRTMPERGVLPARREGSDSFSASQKPENYPNLPCNQSYPMSDIEPNWADLLCVRSARRMFHSEAIAVAYRFKSYSAFPFRRALGQLCSSVMQQKAAIHLGPKLGR